MIPAERALQRQALERPLVLREERVLPRARVHDVRVDVLVEGGREERDTRERDPHEPQSLVVDVHLTVIAPEVALVAELHAV